MISADCLKLTTYFGERDRVGGRLLADALLDLYGARRLQASILLRGTVGFGRLHHLHTDRLLSLSEDLPVVSVAVDRRDRIEAALEEVIRIKRRGLVTLERAWLQAGEPAPEPWPESLDEATKLTFYLGRHERAGGRPAFVALCALLHARGVAGATALLGVDGTRLGERRRAAFFSANTAVPMMVVAVGAGDRIADALAASSDLLEQPLVTLERVRVCKRDGERLATPHQLPGVDEHGLAMWQKLMIYTSEAASHSGRPLHLEIIRRLRASDVAGATSLRGLWGFHGARPPHGDRFLSLRRHVPVVTIVIDSPERIVHAFEIVDELTREHGLVTSEAVPALNAISKSERRGGLRLAYPDY
jgi:PII-like signaling protein